jgi:hypothetical protein
VSAYPVGELKTVTGLVAIRRGGALVPQPVAGDVVYQGDLIDAGMDGSVTIMFHDGTWLRLHPDTRVELDEFPSGAERLPGSAFVRILAGRFEIIDGKFAAHDGITIDTPVGCEAGLRALAPARWPLEFLALRSFQR